MLFKKSKQNTPSFLEKLIGITVEEKTQPVVKEHHVVSRVQFAPPGKSFKLHDGRELRTIQELIKTLPTMSEEEWREYANFGNNHFANWIEGVFDERVLATQVRQAQDKDTMNVTLIEFINSLAT